MPETDWSTIDEHGSRLALEQARKSAAEGGTPIGSVLLVPDGSVSNGFKVIGAGHNEYIQKSSVILHAEMAALENAGRFQTHLFGKATLYTTLSPCSMCSGAILFWKIRRVVIAENKNDMGEEDLLRSRGVEVVVKNDEISRKLLGEYLDKNQDLWRGSRGQ